MERKIKYHFGKVDMFFVTLLLSPVAFDLTQMSGKPVVFNLTDFFIPFYLIVLFLYQVKIPKILFLLSFLNLFFGLLWGGIGALIDEDIVNFLSSVRLYKCFFYIFIGVYFSRIIYVENLYKLFFWLSVFVVTSLIISDFFFTPNFPNARWGGNFFNYDSYGFPNSFAVFISFLSIFFLSTEYTCSRKVISCFTLTLIFAIAMFSLSRASLATFFIYWSLFFMFSGLNQRFKIIAVLTIVPVFIFVVPLLIEYSGLSDALLYKLDRTVNSEHKTSGRYEIWVESLSLISDKLLFGYFFSPYSEYSNYGTPHNQYLEILYKVGFFGFFLYFYSIVNFLISTFFVSLNEDFFEQFRCFVLMICSLLVINTFQPNFSFSTCANLIFFLIGYFYNYSLIKKKS